MTTMAKSASNEPRSGTQRARPSETVVLFIVANQMFAVAADSVHEIRSTDSLSGSAAEIEHPELLKVRHTLDRGSRTYYVVNAGMHFGLPVTRPALVLILRQFRAALLVAEYGVHREAVADPVAFAPAMHAQYVFGWVFHAASFVLCFNMGTFKH